MKTYVRLATIEIRRLRLRYALLTGAVAVLVFLLLFLNALSGSLIQAITGAIENQESDVIVYSDTSRENVEASRLPAETADAVDAVEGVEKADPWVESSFTVGNGGSERTNTTVVGYTVDGAGQPASSTATPRAGQALVDSGNEGDFPVGSTVRFEPAGIELEITGTADNAGFLAQPTLWVDIEQYRELQQATFPGVPPDLPVNVIAVLTEADPVKVAESVETAVPGTVALTRAEAVEAIPGIAEISASFLLIIGATAVIVVVVTGFFFVIFTVQKRSAHGALRALGASVWRLGRATLVQITFVVVVACVVAILLLGLALAGLSAGLPVTVDFGLVIAISVSVLIGGLLAGLISIRRIARIDPAEAASGRAG